MNVTFVTFYLRKRVYKNYANKNFCNYSLVDNVCI